MPLRIKMPAYDRLMINGAVVENSGVATTLVFHNQCDILRQKEIMQEDEATTPARRVYYTLQCAYMFEDDRDKYTDYCEQFLTDYATAAPSSSELIEQIRTLLRKHKFYHALQHVTRLMEHESERLDATP